MYTVGLTGGIGSGKSTIANFFAQLGTHWVDMDDVARLVVAQGEPALELIAQHFNDPQILNTHGELNRALLRNIIFKNPSQKAWLESLLHPLIRARTNQILLASPLGTTNKCYALLVSPLLFEKNIAVDASIAIDVTRDTQIARACKRDNNNPEQIQRIMATQLTRLARNQKADYIINNQQSQAQTQEQVRLLHSKLVTHFNRDIK